MKYIVDIHGEIEGDYEIIGKYEERPQGKWIVTEFYPHKVYGQCSVCKQRKRIDNFCSNCGADMRGEE